jgi:hypothetical protein
MDTQNKVISFQTFSKALRVTRNEKIVKKSDLISKTRTNLEFLYAMLWISASLSTTVINNKKLIFKFYKENLKKTCLTIDYQFLKVNDLLFQIFRLLINNGRKNQARGCSGRQWRAAGNISTIIIIWEHLNEQKMIKWTRLGVWTCGYFILG